MNNNNKSTGGICWEQGLQMITSPHLLIGGTTGSGKSVMLNNLLYSYIAVYPPSNKFIFIDLKRVELANWKQTPFCYMYCDTAIKSLEALQHVSSIIDDRYKIMQDKGLKKYYDSFNLYVVIDELADLMISELKIPIKRELQHILQIGRASNVHIIACTQAPNRKIIPAELVLNFTNRVALRCLSAIESRQIINQSGAEKLEYNGQCLYLDPRNKEIKLLEIPYITEDEISERLQFYQ